MLLQCLSLVTCKCWSATPFRSSRCFQGSGRWFISSCSLSAWEVTVRVVFRGCQTMDRVSASEHGAGSLEIALCFSHECQVSSKGLNFLTTHTDVSLDMRAVPRQDQSDSSEAQRLVHTSHSWTLCLTSRLVYGPKNRAPFKFSRWLKTHARKWLYQSRTEQARLPGQAVHVLCLH